MFANYSVENKCPNYQVDLDTVWWAGGRGRSRPALATGSRDLASAGGDRTGPPLIILPTLNEEGGLATTLDDLDHVHTFPGHSTPAVLVVDGHSTDRTVEIARLRGVHVFLQQGRGKGAAIREALRWARDRGFGAVGVIDADGTYPCDRLPTLFQLLGDGSDVVIGVRRPNRPANVTARDFVHRLGNGVLNLCAAHLSGRPILDVCSGFWGARVAVVDGLDLESDGFEVESELFLKAFRQDLRVVQIPVEYRERIGEAKLQAARDGARILLSIVRNSRNISRVTGTYLLPFRRAGRSAPRRTGSLRTLISVVLALEAPSVVVFSAPSRSAEAADLARALSTTLTDVQVWPLRERAEVLPTGPGGVPSGSGPQLRPQTVQVALPDPSWPVDAATMALVQSPRGRTLFLLGVGGEEPIEYPPPPPEVRAARRRSSGRREMGALEILGAILDPSGIHKERAMVAANADGRQVRVRPGSRLGRQWSQSMGPFVPTTPA